MRRNHTLLIFSLRQALRGALLFGVAASLILIFQSFAFASAYPHLIDRQNFAATLTSQPAFGILFGEPRHVDTPVGYVLYRDLAAIILIGSIWALLSIVRALRGQEESGRLELVLSEGAPLRQVTGTILKAHIIKFGIVYAILVLLLAICGMSKEVTLSVGQSLYLGLVIIAPPLVFTVVGALCSQLAATRRRAVMYGLAVLLPLFVVRSLGVVLPSLHWLEGVTPFGWSINLHAVYSPNPYWFLAFVAAIGLGVIGTLWLAGRRDYGQGIIGERTVAAPHYYWLRHSSWLNLRLQLPVIIGWIVSGMVLSAIIAGIAKTAARAATGSSSLSGELSRLAHASSNELALTFLALGSLLAIIILLLFTITQIQAITSDETNGLLTNILVGNESRLTWLQGRITVIVVTSLVFGVLSTGTSWLTARLVGVMVPWAMIWQSVSWTAVVLLLMGIGLCAYGLRPSLTAPTMYLVLGWSFAVELLNSAVHFNTIVLHTSLLYYAPLLPTTEPKWTHILTLGLVGCGLIGMGGAMVTKRDIAND